MKTLNADHIRGLLATIHLFILLILGQTAKRTKLFVAVPHKLFVCNTE